MDTPNFFYFSLQLAWQIAFYRLITVILAVRA
jgi:hypothetical protein